jgi:ParB-like chromosome segregation protein Spo0J
MPTAEHTISLLPEKWRPEWARVWVNNIDWPEDRLRSRDFGSALAELADSSARNGLQQPIGVKRTGVRFQLIWGCRRLEAYRTAPDRLGKEVEAVVYPEDLPAGWRRILEIDENQQRQDLTPDERAEHSLRIAEELKTIEVQGSDGKSNLSVFDRPAEVKPKPRTGRGNKGKVAEIQRVDQAAVRKRAAKVAGTINEPVDLDSDSPAELRRKADKYREAVKEPKRRKPAKAPHTTSAGYQIGRKQGGRDLVEIFGRVITFTPSAAQRWVQEHPEAADRIRTLAPMVGKIAAAVTATGDVAPEPAAPSLEQARATYLAAVRRELGQSDWQAELTGMVEALGFGLTEVEP